MIDYTEKIIVTDAKMGSASRTIRVYTDSVYDLFHHGHARQLFQGKDMFLKCKVYLIVGVHSQAVVRAKKGDTLMKEAERYEIVRHCRYADCVIQDAPWSNEIDEKMLSRHEIHFVAHADIPSFSENTKGIYRDLKKKGRFAATNRTEGVSTSDIITRVLKNYDTYIKRNMQRGYMREQLNYGHVHAVFFAAEAIKK